ncbi:MAG: CARDB domain-containing protein [Acidobacteriota bacterium]
MLRPTIRALSRASFFLAALVLASAAWGDIGGPDAAGHVWCSETIECFVVQEGDLPSRTVAFPADANHVGPIPLGFDFPFHGRQVDSIWVHRNGLIGFEEPPDMPLDVPGTLGSPELPNGFLAAYWADLRITGEQLLYESRGREGFRLHLDAWRLDFPDPVQLDVHLEPDGGIRLEYLYVPEFFWRATEPTIGIEDFTGTVGLTLLHVDRPDPALQLSRFPQSPFAACIHRPSSLETLVEGEVTTVDCGRHSGSISAGALSLVEDYGCAPTSFPGGEAVHRLVLDELTDVELRLVDSPGLTIVLLGSAHELHCLGSGDDRVRVEAVPPGEYLVVIDGSWLGPRDYVFEIDCAPTAQPIECGDVVRGRTVGEGTLLFHDCLESEQPGPEAIYAFDVSSEELFEARLIDASGQSVAIYRADDPLVPASCLAGGVGSAAAAALEPGRYLIVVDGPAAGEFTLELTCGTQLACETAVDLSCGASLTGDTRDGEARVSHHPCLEVPLEGAESVFRLHVPAEQSVEARLISSQPFQHLLLLSDCSEGSCLRTDGLSSGCVRLPAGDHYLVVDGPPGLEGPFEIRVDCSDSGRDGLDLRVTSVDNAGLTGSCESFDVEGTTRVVVSNNGSIDVEQPFEIVVFQDDPSAPNGAWDPGTDDELGRVVPPASPAAPLPAGQSVSVDVPVTGRLLFRDNVLHAVVDPAGALVDDRDPTNDVFDTGRSCRHQPSGEFIPIIEWHVASFDREPEFTWGSMTPVVGDVNADGWPDIAAAFGTSRRGPGRARLFDGRDGTVHWTAWEQEVFSTSNFALGELDGDPELEIVAQGPMSGRRFVVFDADGSVMGTTARLHEGHWEYGFGGESPSLADLDADGRPEIIVGNSAFNTGADLGTEFWIPDVGTLGRNHNNETGVDGAVSVLADVTGDGLLEVIAGPTAYRWNLASGRGEILWTRRNLGDGYAAVGNFDTDPEPEIAVVGSGWLNLLEGDSGDLVWRTRLPHGGGGCRLLTGIDGGPPTIADVDGDCRPEIGVAGADFYTVFEHDGRVRWSAPIVDCSSHRTSSSVFDFEGDGVEELVIRDENSLHVFDGRTGDTVLQMPSSSHTWLEMVAIADVDADDNAEIVVPLNRGGGRGWQGEGLQVIGDFNDNWVTTRRIWNQHSYHVGNVNDDGTIPTHEVDSWTDHGTYRSQVGEQRFSAADITTSITSLTVEPTGECGREVVVTARVGNGGAVATSTAIEVSVYLQEADELTWLQTTTLPSLEPGSFEDLEVRVPPPRFGELAILVVADDDGSGTFTDRVNECREDNNSCVALVDNEVDVGMHEPPAPVGNALRPAVLPFGAHGGHFGEGWVEFTWSLDEGAPRPLGDHFRLKRSTDPRSVDLIVTPPNHSETGFRDDPPEVAERPHLYFYRAIAVERCGIEEDEPLP